jgi:hypothetical protein
MKMKTRAAECSTGFFIWQINQKCYLIKCNLLAQNNALYLII